MSGNYSDVEWEVWYQDTFDRECPPRVDVKGRGLVNGLMELWARFLFETVTADGRQGFSRFWLASKPQPGFFNTNGDWDGAVKLRKWVFGDKRSTTKGYVREADQKLLKHIASRHVDGLASEQILHLAATSTNRTEFEQRLNEIEHKQRKTC